MNATGVGQSTYDGLPEQLEDFLRKHDRGDDDMRLCITLALLAFAWPALADSGPALETTAPAFELPDQDGNERSLASLLEKGRTALLFYRSADW